MAYLQIIDAILFLLCGILTSIFIFICKPGEILHSRVKLLGVIFSATVTSLGILLSIASGEHVDLLRDFWPTLHTMSQSTTVLLLFLTLVLLSCVFLLHQLIFYRHVEFTADKPLRVFLNDQPGSLQEIAVLQQNKPSNLRLRVGHHRLVGEDPVNAMVLATAAVTVKWLRNPGILLKASPTSDFVATSPSEPEED